jgi:alpha-galactosidase
MTVDDRTRMELHRRLTEVLGDQEADTLMAHLPPVTWQNVATTDSVDSTRVVLATQIDALRSDVDRHVTELRSDVHGQITQLRADLGGQITELRSDLNGHVTALNSALSTGLSDLRAEMHRTTRSIVVLVAALTTAAVALGGILT